MSLQIQWQATYETKIEGDESVEPNTMLWSNGDVVTFADINDIKKVMEDYHVGLALNDKPLDDLTVYFNPVDMAAYCAAFSLKANS